MIRNSPDAYAQAYLLSEQDDLDITYFFDYHLKKILRAVASFEKYLEQTVRENREVEVLLGKQFRLNERQKQVIHHLLAEGSHAYVTTNMHKTMNRVSRLTARKDLLALQKKQLLSLEKVGKNNRYYPTQKLVAMKKHWISWQTARVIVYNIVSKHFTASYAFFR